MRIKVLLFLMVGALYSFSSCKKCYQCDWQKPIYFECVKNGDTLRFSVNGLARFKEQIEKKYEAQGYNCYDSIVTFGISYPRSPDECLTKDEAEYYNWQGNDCSVNTTNP